MTFFEERGYTVSMQKIRVGVVRGGPSSEYAISLQTGDSVLRNLDTEKYFPVDILLTAHGEWYMRGTQIDLEAIVGHVDVIWNALHGTFGEDGKVQQLFESFAIPYTGSDVLASALGMHKGLAKERFRQVGLATPEGIVVTNADNFDDVLSLLAKNPRLRPPVIVKPVAGGSSIATSIARNIPELKEAVIQASRYGDVLIEEYVEGSEATVGVVDGSTPGEYFALFPVEIVPPATNPFYDYDAKYGGRSQAIGPGNFTEVTRDELRKLAVAAHQAIGARHYSRTDFVLSPKGIYTLEINTLPELSGLFPKALQGSRTEFPEFLDHVIKLALAE